MSLRLLLAALVGWLDQRQVQAMAYLIEENRILRGHVRGRLRLTDEDAGGWRGTDTGWVVVASVRSRRLLRQTRFCGGIGT